MSEGLMKFFADFSGPFIAAAGLVAGVWYRLENKLEASRTASAAVEKSLNDFKLKVTEEYASWDTVRNIENRLTERMDDLSENVLKMPDAVLDRIIKYLSIAPPK